MQVFGIEVKPTNKRRAKCPDCKKILEKGEGIGHRYPMFHGNGEFYYLCPKCHDKRMMDNEQSQDNMRQHG